MMIVARSDVRWFLRPRLLTLLGFALAFLGSACGGPMPPGGDGGPPAFRVLYRLQIDSADEVVDRVTDGQCAIDSSGRLTFDVGTAGPTRVQGLASAQPLVVSGPRFGPAMDFGSLPAHRVTVTETGPGAYHVQFSRAADGISDLRAGGVDGRTEDPELGDLWLSGCAL